ncbi:MAG: nucleolar DEAD-box protein required for synthesis of 60S ribosomal subunit [Ramalina farinacea]|uniref:Nucleolar DEAD-box protein required for synthesis of 60S ribosomal subunit n=1 Tax=Ramalina farinacea TaxID=258253 RepID=A0AA43TS44_9LECA|nr:nucleolar DEAD-box protein required for synthesis of 60S ribosomal subunit [Ramalina farinacea]
MASGTTTKFNATFENLPALPEEGRLSPVGTYMDISYPNFDLSNPLLAVAGLLPQGKIYIFGAGSSASPAEMTTSYTGSKIKSIALESLYYGCQTNLGQAAASLPVACTITATGYRNGAVVAVQEFQFTPTNKVKAPLAFGKFKSAFTNLQTVTYNQSPATGTEFLLDTIVGTKQT